MRFNLLRTVVIGALCYVAVPHPYCYTLDSRKETAIELHLFYKENEFFLDCDRDTRSIIHTEKDIVIYIDGNVTQTMRNKDICPETDQ